MLQITRYPDDATQALLEQAAQADMVYRKAAGCLK